MANDLCPIVLNYALTTLFVKLFNPYFLASHVTDKR